MIDICEEYRIGARLYPFPEFVGSTNGEMERDRLRELITQSATETIEECGSWINRLRLTLYSYWDTFYQEAITCSVKEKHTTLENSIFDLLEDYTVIRHNFDELFDKEIRRLVQNGSVEKARLVIQAAKISNNYTSRIAGWERVLAPPRTIVTEGSTGKNMSLNSEWLRENYDNYKGRWVALRDGQLIGSNPSRKELQLELRKKGQLAGSIFIKIVKE